ncbi:DNA primase family protein [Ruegeria arenilitoris]|uniref:DNA primase family protein n=1 Tax=Ruegeria arenilitoris TaxID=1173585 RepID=UPI00147ECBF3|nr:phage/plasmid primase, P4 family [Ruegeria arenilitoris]
MDKITPVTNLVSVSSVSGNEIIEKDDFLKIEGEADFAAKIYPHLRGKIAYVHQRAKWMVFDGSIWKLDEIEVHRAMVREIVDKALKIVPPDRTRLRAKMQSSHYVSAVLKELRSMKDIAVSVETLDANPYILGTPGGYVDLKTGRMLKPNPMMWVTKSTNVTPAEDPNCPTFMWVLGQAHAGQEEIIDWFLTWIGYCLTGEAALEMAIVNRGSGGNGKGTIYSGIMNAAGDYMSSAADDAFTVDRHGNTSSDTSIAALVGARLIVLSEPTDGRMWNTGRLKAFTGNEVPITARFLYKDNFSYMPTGKVNVNANFDIGLKTVDDAMKRRLRIVPWPHSIPKEEQDTTLKERLAAEAPGILRLLIQKAVEFVDYHLRYKRFLPDPKIVEEATSEYFDSQDPVSRFMSLCTQSTESPDDSGIKQARLVEVYNRWAHNNGEEKKRYMAKDCERLGYRKSTTSGSTYIRAIDFSDVGRVIADEVDELKGRGGL